MSPSPHQPGDDWLPGVIELLDRQRVFFRELESLSREQSKFVGEGQTERLLGVLAVKQRVVERVQGVSASLQAYMGDWTGRVAALPERSRVLLRTRTDELEQLAAQVQARDDSDRAALEAQSRVIADELAATARAKGAARAYGAQGVGVGSSPGLFPGLGGGGGGVAPRFQDRKG